MSEHCDSCQDQGCHKCAYGQDKEVARLTAELAAEKYAREKAEIKLDGTVKAWNNLEVGLSRLHCSYPPRPICSSHALISATGDFWDAAIEVDRLWDEMDKTLSSCGQSLLDELVLLRSESKRWEKAFQDETLARSKDIDEKEYLRRELTSGVGALGKSRLDELVRLRKEVEELRGKP